MKQVLFSLVFLTCYIFSIAQNPTLQWAKSMGGTNSDIANHIAIDKYGNVYTTGHYRFTADFDPNAGVTTLTSVNNNPDIFISKLDSAGNFIWAKSMGGISSEYGNSIVTDTSGNVYIVGRFAKTVDFDPGAGVLNLTAVGNMDIFICKLDANGNLIWAKSFVGSMDDIGTSIAVDAAQNVYTTGDFQDSLDLDPGPGTFYAVSGGTRNVFISKLDINGNFLWGGAFISNSNCHGLEITLDTFGNIFTTGHFSAQTDFDPGPGVYNLTPVNNADAFISKLDAAGNFIWAKNIGGVNQDYGESIAIDGAGNVYTTGYFDGTVDFDPNAGVANLVSGNRDIFISKLDASGNYVWAKNVGGPGNDDGQSITLDAAGNVYTAGWFTLTADFDPNGGVFNLSAGGVYDAFICKLTPEGNFIWAQNIGGSNSDYAHALRVDLNYDVYVTGYYAGTADFDPGPGVMNITSAGMDDFYVIRLKQPGLSISEDKDETNTIYPNPFSGIFNISLYSKTEITITNLLGEIVLTCSMEAGYQTIDLQNQPSGIYFVHLVNENKKEAVKLIKQ